MDDFIKIIMDQATQGNPAFQEMLADSYYHGENVKQSYKDAVKWLTEAAKKGRKSAQIKLGTYYYEGIVVE